MKRIKDIKGSFARARARQMIDEADAIARYCVGNDLKDVASWIGLSVADVEHYLDVYAMTRAIGEGAMKKHLTKLLKK